MVRLFFGLHLYLAGRCCENPQSTRGNAQCKSGPGIKWLVSVTIYWTIFQKQFISTLPVFTHKILLKKSARWNAHRTNYWIWIKGPWAPWPYMYSYEWLISWQNKNIWENSLNRLLFTAKILQEAMFLTSPYLGQIKHLQLKFNNKLQEFLTCFGLKLQVKGGLNNLIFLVDFQMLKI